MRCAWVVRRTISRKPLTSKQLPHPKSQKYPAPPPSARTPPPGSRSRTPCPPGSHAARRSAVPPRIRRRRRHPGRPPRRQLRLVHQHFEPPRRQVRAARRPRSAAAPAARRHAIPARRAARRRHRTSPTSARPKFRSMSRVPCLINAFGDRQHPPLRHSRPAQRPGVAQHQHMLRRHLQALVLDRRLHFRIAVEHQRRPLMPMKARVAGRRLITAPSGQRFPLSTASDPSG